MERCTVDSLFDSGETAAAGGSVLQCIFTHPTQFGTTALIFLFCDTIDAFMFFTSVCHAVAWAFTIQAWKYMALVLHYCAGSIVRGNLIHPFQSMHLEVIHTIILVFLRASRIIGMDFV